ncbi:hypothetical protein OAU00_03410 [Saprospiraceae bacterium]|nr:hypothetical protein [Saprospiraceae bacterium]
MQKNNNSAKPITEGYLAGLAALIVTFLWIDDAPFSPWIILPLYLIGLICLAIPTLWILSKDRPIKDWVLQQPSRYFSIGLLGIILIIGFFEIVF